MNAVPIRKNPEAKHFAIKAHLTQSWIFSPAIDVLAFLLPFIVGIGFLVSLKPLGISAERELFPFSLSAIFIFGLNYPHTISTTVRTLLHTNAIGFPQRVMIVSSLVLIGLFVASIHSFTLTMHLMTALAVFHGARQDFGWMKIASRSETKLGVMDHYINSYAIYTAHIAPAVWLLSFENSAFWFQKGDFPHLIPSELGNLVLVAYNLVLAVYVLRQTWLWLRFRYFAVTKNCIMISAAITWYVVMIQNKLDSAWQLVLPVLIHTVPYIFLTFRYGLWRSGIQRHNRLFAIIFAYTAFVFGGVVHFSLGPSAFGNDSQFLSSLFFSLFVFPQVWHFVIDGFIWKPGRDAGLRRFFSAEKYSLELKS
jgi:hypothetical protein